MRLLKFCYIVWLFSFVYAFFFLSFSASTFLTLAVNVLHETKILRSNFIRKLKIGFHLFWKSILNSINFEWIWREKKIPQVMPPNGKDCFRFIGARGKKLECHFRVNKYKIHRFYLDWIKMTVSHFVEIFFHSFKRIFLRKTILSTDFLSMLCGGCFHKISPLRRYTMTNIKVLHFPTRTKM